MRTDKELIKVCIDNYNINVYSGLCILVSGLTLYDILSYQEAERLVSIFYKYIKRNTFWNKFLYDKRRISSYKDTDSGRNPFFWRPYEKEPRLNYLQYLYNKLK